MKATKSRRAAICRCLIVLAALVLWPAHLTAGTDPRVGALLDRMTKSVLEGDIEGYLAYVDRTDPVFWKEQQNWAADFKRHMPKEFSLRFEPGAVVIRDGEAVVPLTMSWAMELPWSRARELTYTARLTEREGRWLFAGERWNVLEGPGVKALFADGLGEVAKVVVELLPEVREHVDAGFGIHIQQVQEVKLYSSMKHLQGSIYLSYADGLEGWNEPGESIKILARRKTGAAELRPLLAHEYGHVATFELGPRANEMPWWILEGVAELAAERYGNPGVVNAMVRAWAGQGRLVPWERLSDFHTVKGQDQQHVYTQGHHMIGFISDRYGRSGRNTWLTAMSQGKSIDEATVQLTGMDFAGLDALWRKSLEKDDGDGADLRAD